MRGAPRIFIIFLISLQVRILEDKTIKAIEIRLLCIPSNPTSKSLSERFLKERLAFRLLNASCKFITVVEENNTNRRKSVPSSEPHAVWLGTRIYTPETIRKSFHECNRNVTVMRHLS